MRSKIAHLPNIHLNHAQLNNIIFSWSIAPQFLIAHSENNMPLPEERIAAALQACNYGYKVAFHFDPIIFYPDWCKDYSVLIAMIRRNIPATSISYFTAGTLRFPRNFFNVINQKYRSHWIFQDEFIPVLKDTYSYLRKIRKNLYRELVKMLKYSSPLACPVHIMEADSAFANMIK